MICRRYMPAIRRRPTVWQYCNPIWWLGDDCRPLSVPYYSWRNFAMNFFATVIGMEATDHAWFGTMPNTFPAHGFGCGIICSRWIVLPYVCHRGSHIEWSIGWKPAGAFSVTIRPSNATPA